MDSKASAWLLETCGYQCVAGRMIGAAKYAHHTDEQTEHHNRTGKVYQDRREGRPKKIKGD
jgi:hypothetical protein